MSEQQGLDQAVTDAGRTGRRPGTVAVVLVAVATMLATMLYGVGVSSAGGGGKTVICHATASNSNPWVRIEVNNNALPAHFGEVGNSHSHQQSLGRDDFEWTPDYDEECIRVAVPDPILAECVGTDVSLGPVIGISYDQNGVPTQHPVPCTEIHGYVPLPIGVTHIQCPSGTALAPKWYTYQLTPTSGYYGVNCLAGDIVDLGLQGGPAQVLCPASGSVTMYRRNFLSSVVAVASPCTPGSFFPSGAGVSPFVDVIDWNNSYPWIQGLVECQADTQSTTGGSLKLYFMGEGAPATSSNDFVTFPCTPGSQVDITRLTLTI